MAALVKIHRLIIAVFLGLSFCGSALAEIYETTDSEGNSVFTDKPAQESAPVELGETNISDAIEPATAPSGERLPGPEASSGSRGEASKDSDNVIYMGDERNEVLEAEPRHEVLDANTRHEVLDAEQRDEVPSR
jgi:hypothetical protein